MGFEFPPPVKGSKPAVGQTGPPVGEPGSKFILPPPQGSSRSDATEVVRQVGQALGQFGETADWAAQTTVNQGQVLADYGDAIGTKVEAWAVPTIAPLSSTINRRADPSFQLSDFLMPNLDVLGTTGVADGHSHNGNSLQLVPKNWETGNAKGRIYTTFITPAINRVYERLNLISTAVSSPCTLDIAIYVVDPETRLMSRQVHIPNAGAALGGTEAVISVEFPPWVATQGSYIAVAYVQYGTGNARAFHGLRSADRPLPTAYFPRSIAAASPTGSSYTGLPATMDGNDSVLIDFTYVYTPYVELSENIGIEYKSFVENWTSTGAMARPWVKLTSTSIYSGGGYVGAGGFGYRVSMYDTPLASEHTRTTTSVHRVFDNDRRSTLIFRGSNNLRSGVGVQIVPGSGYRLVQWTNVAVDASWDTRSVVATFGPVPAAGDNIVIEYHAGLVDVWINGEHLVVAMSVAGPSGAAGRFVGIQTDRAGNVFFAYPSPQIGPWNAKDIPADEGDGTGDTG